jgi:predicted aldo/keto reductase-like oxidoreductase
MELLMYARRYGMGDFARKRFAELPGEVRNKIAGSDYSMAERDCPQKMPIAQLMKQACEELSNQ